jgi:hypothetical protein
LLPIFAFWKNENDGAVKITKKKGKKLKISKKFSRYIKSGLKIYFQDKNK